MLVLSQVMSYALFSDICFAYIVCPYGYKPEQFVLTVQYVYSLYEITLLFIQIVLKFNYHSKNVSLKQG